MRGKIVIISSPSGGGKTSICRRLLTPARRRAGWTFSISYTTRSPRVGERNGREYYFVSDAEFDRLARKGFFAEYFRVHLYMYGTSRSSLERVRRRGGVMLLDVDIKGAHRLRQEYPDAISIFVLPPSVTALKRRLKKQEHSQKVEQLAIRLTNAIQEMRSFSEQGFDYVVINKELDAAVRKVFSIVDAHDCRIENCDPERIRKITG